MPIHSSHGRKGPERASKRMKPASGAMRARFAKYRKESSKALQGMSARVRKVMRGGQ